MTLEALVQVAGLGQIALSLASTAVPVVLRWREETARLRPLLRQLFWVYGGYILAINFSFGLLSVLAPKALLDGSTLAGAVSGFIAVYWGARLLIQIFVFERGDVPQGARYRVAEAALLSLFAFLTGVYAAACAANLLR